MHGLKAKGQTARAETTPRRANLARAEVVDKAVRGRLEAELEGLMKAHGPKDAASPGAPPPGAAEASPAPAAPGPLPKENGAGVKDASHRERRLAEAKLVGAFRALAPLSPSLRGTLGDAVGVLVRQGALDRELYTGGLRCLAESGDPQATAILKLALASDEAGGTAALTGACFNRDASLAPLLTKIAASRQSHLAFSAETARVVRGESTGTHLAGLAPMIKESHRISLCTELFFPLLRGAPVPAVIGPALSVLRSAERHLGRWLVLGEVAALAGDATALEEARQKSQSGPQSARAAWSLVGWALKASVTRARGGEPVSHPEVRPTVELMARLSDRPSADRDPTFLFRMAAAKIPSTRAMLESIAKGPPLADEAAVRAAFYLVRDHGRSELRAALEELAGPASPKEELRGLAAAALWDLAVGDAPTRERLRGLAEDLVASSSLANLAWGTLLRVAALKAEGSPKEGSEAILTESAYRWVQLGWLE